MCDLLYKLITTNLVNKCCRFIARQTSRKTEKPNCISKVMLFYIQE